MAEEAGLTPARARPELGPSCVVLEAPPRGSQGLAVVGAPSIC